VGQRLVTSCCHPFCRPVFSVTCGKCRRVVCAHNKQELACNGFKCSSQITCIDVDIIIPFVFLLVNVDDSVTHLVWCVLVKSCSSDGVLWRKLSACPSTQPFANLLPHRCRVLTTDVPSDIVVEAGGMNFSLHKVRVLSSGTSVAFPPSRACMFLE